jgi:hypothetical protein
MITKNVDWNNASTSYVKNEIATPLSSSLAEKHISQSALHTGSINLQPILDYTSRNEKKINYLC